MDPDGLTLACATRAEERAGRRAGLRTVLVGLAAANGVPAGPVVSYGLAGSLDGLARGAVLDVTRVVDERGETLWKGAGLGIPGAVPATIAAVDRLVDDPAERQALRRASGADAVDMESGALARGGELRGVLRVVADTPDRPLSGLDGAVTAGGRTSTAGLVRALARSPRAATRAALDAKRALDVLAAATRRWAGA